MAGWNTDNVNISVESVEEFVDTNPDLYKQRTIAALNEKRYKDALEEANKALEYSNKELQYHLLVARVYFEAQIYESCYNKLISAGLLRYVNEDYDKGELLMDEMDFVFYSYAVCYKKLGKSNANVETIVVTPDGKGMCQTLQAAVNVAKSNQIIMMTCGTYTGDVKISNKDVSIYGTPMGMRNRSIYPVLTGKITIENSKAEIIALKFNGKDTSEQIIKIDDSNVYLNECVFSDKNNITGIYVYKNSECEVEFCDFFGLDIGITNEVNRNILTVIKSCFKSNRVGVVATDITEIVGCDFIKNRDAGVYPVVSRGEKISARESTFEENGCGLIIVDSYIDIQKSKFYRNHYHIAFKDAGYFVVRNSSFIGAKGPCFIGERDTKKNRKLKEYVGYMIFEDCLLENNNSLARSDNRGMTLLKSEKNLTIRNNGELNSYAEGIKSFLDKWL